MLQALNDFDVALFLFLNNFHSNFFDFFFYWITQKFFWVPLYVYLLWYLYKSEKVDIVALLIAIVFSITLSDQLSSTVLKNWVMRLRPCNDPSLAGLIHTVNGYCGGMYSFVSSHAANSFSLVAFILTILKGRKWAFRYYFLFWAILHSYSRIYLGVHYPGDIICGALLGLLVGFFVAKLYLYYKKLRHPKIENSNIQN